MKVKSEREVAQSCPTLRDPMDCSLPGSSIHGIFRHEYWNGVPLPSLISNIVKIIKYSVAIKAVDKKMYVLKIFVRESNLFRVLLFHVFELCSLSRLIASGRSHGVFHIPVQNL